MASEDDASDAPAIAHFSLPAWSDALLDDAPTELLTPLRERLRAAGLDGGASRAAHRVEDWWIEGDRACVTLAGVTAFDATDEDPAEERAMGWLFLLYRRSGVWSLRNVSETSRD